MFGSKSVDFFDDADIPYYKFRVDFTVPIEDSIGMCTQFFAFTASLGPSPAQKNEPEFEVA